MLNSIRNLESTTNKLIQEPKFDHALMTRHLMKNMQLTYIRAFLFLYTYLDLDIDGDRRAGSSSQQIRKNN